MTPEVQADLDEHIGRWVLTLNAWVHQAASDRWDEAMGYVLGRTTEHVLASDLHGQIVERLRFAEAFNAEGGTLWELRYIDPERLAE
jgi:hypothetical protein